METTEKEQKSLDAKPLPKPMRTQTFSQNHPALSNQDLPKQNVNVLPPLPITQNYPPPLNQNTFPPPQQQQQQQRNLFPPPYQYPPAFTPWKAEEQQRPPASWWPQNQNYPPPQPQDNVNFQQQYQYLENFSDYSSGNKVGYSPWRRQQQQQPPQQQQQQQRGFVGGGFEGQGQNLSMRQVMLKEAVNIMPNFASQNPVRTNTVSLDGV